MSPEDPGNERLLWTIVSYPDCIQTGRTGRRRPLGCPGGESPDQVGARVDRVIGRVQAAGGPVALFAHGHVFRVFVARWIGLPPTHGRHFLLDTSTLSVLGYYRGEPAVRCWNAPVEDGIGAAR